MVLLVNQHTVPLFVDIANAFARSGERVTLFTGHIELGKHPLDSSIHIIQSKSYQRASSLSRISSWLLFSAHYIIYLTFCRKPSKILVATNPPIALLITAVLARIRNLSTYLLIYDLYPEALSQAGFTRSSHWLYRRWQKVNPWIFRNAEKIFTLSDSMKNAVSVYTLGDDSKIKVIHNWVDTSYITPLSKETNPLIDAWGVRNKRVVLYAGNMGLTHDLKSLLEAAYLLRNRQDMVFVLIGDGGQRDMLIKYQLERNLKNVLFLPFQTADQFPLAMAAADIGIVTLGLGAEGISVPSKTYVAMAAGLCLISIAPLDSELTRLVQEYKTGITLQPDQPTQLAEQISFLVDHPDKLNSFQQAARQASFQFSPDNAFLYVTSMIEANSQQPTANSQPPTANS